MCICYSDPQRWKSSPSQLTPWEKFCQVAQADNYLPDSSHLHTQVERTTVRVKLACRLSCLGFHASSYAASYFDWGFRKQARTSQVTSKPVTRDWGTERTSSSLP